MGPLGIEIVAMARLAERARIAQEIDSSAWQWWTEQEPESIVATVLRWIEKPVIRRGNGIAGTPVNAPRFARSSAASLNEGFG